MQFPEHASGNRSTDQRVRKLEKLATLLRVTIEIDGVKYGEGVDKSPTQLPDDPAPVDAAPVVGHVVEKPVKEKTPTPKTKSTTKAEPKVSEPKETKPKGRKPKVT